MDIDAKQFARRFYDSYSFVLMETKENFADLYKVCRFRLWKEDKELSITEIQDIWEIVLNEYVKDCNHQRPFDSYEDKKEERKYLLADAKKCLHKFGNEDLRHMIFENELRDVEHYELDEYWGIKQADLIIGYDEEKTKETIDAYRNLEENKKSISKKVNQLSPIAIAKMMEIIKEDTR